jgi:hypothetical protein
MGIGDTIQPAAQFHTPRTPQPPRRLAISGSWQPAIYVWQHHLQRASATNTVSVHVLPIWSAIGLASPRFIAMLYSQHHPFPPFSYSPFHLKLNVPYRCHVKRHKESSISHTDAKVKATKKAAFSIQMPRQTPQRKQHFPYRYQGKSHKEKRRVAKR